MLNLVTMYVAWNSIVWLVRSPNHQILVAIIVIVEENTGPKLRFPYVVLTKYELSYTCLAEDRAEFL